MAAASRPFMNSFGKWGKIFMANSKCDKQAGFLLDSVDS